MVNISRENMRTELKLKVLETIFKYDQLNEPELFTVFLEHLVHVGLVEYTNDPRLPGREFSGHLDLRDEEHNFRAFHFIKLTSFGQLFHKACIS